MFLCVCVCGLKGPPYGVQYEYDFTRTVRRRSTTNSEDLLSAISQDQQRFSLRLLCKTPSWCFSAVPTRCKGWKGCDARLLEAVQREETCCTWDCARITVVESLALLLVYLNIVQRHLTKVDALRSFDSPTLRR